MADPATEAVALEVETLARRKPTLKERTRNLQAQMFEMRTLRAYRRIFLNPATGELSSDGALVLADLARAAGMGKVAAYGASGEELNFREGRRAIPLHIFARLGRGKLKRLAQKMRETNDA